MKICLLHFHRRLHHTTRDAPLDHGTLKGLLRLSLPGLFSSPLFVFEILVFEALVFEALFFSFQSNVGTSRRAGLPTTLRGLPARWEERSDGGGPISSVGRPVRGRSPPVQDAKRPKLRLFCNSGYLRLSRGRRIIGARPGDLVETRGFAGCQGDSAQYNSNLLSLFGKFSSIGAVIRRRVQALWPRTGSFRDIFSPDFRTDYPIASAGSCDPVGSAILSLAEGTSSPFRGVVSLGARRVPDSPQLRKFSVCHRRGSLGAPSEVTSGL